MYLKYFLNFPNFINMKTIRSMMTMAAMACLVMVSCKEKAGNPDPVVPPPDQFIRGADLSFLPEIEGEGTVFYNEGMQAGDVLSIFRAKGMNTVRIRLWHTPQGIHSSFAEVKEFSERVRSAGMKVWLTVHYSGHWADPGKQYPPTEWQGLEFEVLKDSVYAYTMKIMNGIGPDIIQIGNEVNNGFLWPYGHIWDNEAQFVGLLDEGCRAVRDHGGNTRIMIQYAGYDGADAFFTKIAGVDYDQIGLSYYPWWHGEDLNLLETTMTLLREKYGKEVLIAELAYPFTMDWDDWTNNIVGSEEQLILPAYPASPEGQRSLLMRVRNIVVSAGGKGFAYWAPEWIAFRGPEATDGSPWENLALFDFDHRLLPGADVFGQ